MIKDKKKSFRKIRKQKVLVVEESKSKWTESESEVSSSNGSSSESDEKSFQCLMANGDLKIKNDEVFNFTSNEFTRNDLIIALSEIVMEFKGLANI